MAGKKRMSKSEKAAQKAMTDALAGALGQVRQKARRMGLWATLRSIAFRGRFGLLGLAATLALYVAGWIAVWYAVPWGWVIVAGLVLIVVTIGATGRMTRVVDQAWIVFPLALGVALTAWKVISRAA